MRLNFKCVRIKYLWGKKKQQKSINGKKEHENVDVLEQWTMADGIFFGFDNRRSDNELESTVLGHRKKNTKLFTLTKIFQNLHNLTHSAYAVYDSYQ